MSEIRMEIKREIDKFGRLTIPAEFRQGMDINLGEPVVLALTGGGELRLRKARSIAGHREAIRRDIRVLREMIDIDVMVCNLSHVVTACANDGELEGARITGQLEACLQHHGDYVYHEGKQIYPLVGRDVPALAIKGIQSNGKPAGYIVALADNENPEPLDSTAVQLMEYAARLVQRYL